MGVSSTGRRRPARGGHGVALSLAAVAVLVAAGVAGLVLSSGGTGAPSPKWVAAGSPTTGVTTTTAGPTTSTTSRAQAAAQLLSAVSVTPARGASEVGAGTVVKVRASTGRLGSVDVRSSTGASVSGSLGTSGAVWVSSSHLVPATRYTVSYQVEGTGGVTASGSSSFSTAPPPKAVTATVWPAPGLIVGVGEPIVFTFSRPVLTYVGQSSVVSHLHIAMSKPVPGGWHWFSPVELHFRPSQYWPVGEQVAVSGDLAGWHIATGEWGSGAVSTQFAVGAKHVSIVNLDTHEMNVYDNGQLVYTWPISAGAPRWPTTAGTHIVLDREAVVRMDSATVGIPVNSPGGYDELVYWDVHIADAGEYVHAAPWDLSIQGQQNVSHGCINISPARAETFLHFSRVGDIVQVVGPGRPPRVTDHGLMDWSFGPSVVKWVPAQVSQLSTPVSTTSPTTLPPPPSGAPFYPTTIPPAPTTTATVPSSSTSAPPPTSTSVATTAATTSAGAPTTVTSVATTATNVATTATNVATTATNHPTTLVTAATTTRPTTAGAATPPPARPTTTASAAGSSVPTTAPATGTASAPVPVVTQSRRSAGT